ncbi:MAG: cupin domain-containing protein, partial [Myxococcales bacterium]|nr:cupin domain-containing protein [Myxococcales bacterium]
WSQVPSIAVDVAVMERTPLAAVVPVEMGWTDLGSFGALREASPLDPAGNALRGDAVQLDSQGCYMHGEDILVAGVGLEGLVVVGTPDAVLVAPLDRAGEVKELVEALGPRDEVEEHPRAERPWGRYRVVDRGEGFQVKRLVVTPGECLSLQRHAHRDEHWIVVGGVGRVEVDGEVRSLAVGDHVLVRAGQAHRLENVGGVDLHLVEVQVGPYLGEDDIERLEDVYGRGNGD